MKNVDLILIGNGPSAKEFEAGDVIDEIPNVCRFNKYYLGKWSKYVGSRTTHWVTYWGYGKEDDYKEVLSTCYKSKARFKRFRKAYPIAKVFSNDVIARGIDLVGYDQPSAGIFALVHYVEFSEFNNIVVYGFDNFMGETHHYAGNRGFLGHHRPDLEHKLFMKYYEDGKIHYLRDSL